MTPDWFTAVCTGLMNLNTTDRPLCQTRVRQET